MNQIGQKFLGNYIIYSDGKIFSRSRQKTMKCFVVANVLQFNSTDTHNKESVALLVAKLFLPNPDERRKVRHKDANYLNCSVENLEWI